MSKPKSMSFSDQYLPKKYDRAISVKPMAIFHNSYVIHIRVRNRILSTLILAPDKEHLDAVAEAMLNAGDYQSEDVSYACASPYRLSHN